MTHQTPTVLTGAFAPVTDEVVIDKFEIEGEVPRDLNGVYVRNGPNRMFEADGRYHWFDGDGMLHAVRFDNGRVEYRNRWVETRALAEEKRAGRALWSGIKEPPRRDRPDMPLKCTSNTDVKFFGGDLLSMWYLGGDIYRCDPLSLATRGRLQENAALAGLPLSAHSKVDERTGEFLFFAYGTKAPYLWYGSLDRHGTLQGIVDVPTPGPRLPHDMAITANHVVLHDFPLFHDAEALRVGRHKLRFHPDMPSRFAVVPRRSGAGGVRWFEAAPTFMYHVANAWEQDDGAGGTEIVMRGTPFRLPRTAGGEIDSDRFAKMVATLGNDFVFHEWRLNLRTGSTAERVIDDIVNSEFPCIDSAYQGHRTDKSWHLLMGRSDRPEDPQFRGLVHYDLARGRSVSYHEGPERWWSEAPFAPRDNPKGEGDGYVVGFVWNGAERKSKVYVFDADDIAQGPICRITVPRIVPNGFHATWVSAARLARGY